MLYPTPVPPDVAADPNSYPPFRQLDTAVVATLAAELAADVDVDAPSALVGALTKALCCARPSARHWPR